jgi:hypothetical protein
MNENPSTSFTILSQAALLRLLREQGVTDLEALVQKGLDVAQEAAEKSDEAIDIFISPHYVYIAI